MTLRHQTGQAFAMRAVLVNVMLAGVAWGAPLADTQADYSTGAQGANGFQYGDYHNDATDHYNNNGVGVFDTTRWTGDGSSFLDGNEGLGTPSVGAATQH